MLLMQKLDPQDCYATSIGETIQSAASMSSHLEQIQIEIYTELETWEQSNQAEYTAATGHGPLPLQKCKADGQTNALKNMREHVVLRQFPNVRYCIDPGIHI
jgi:hypothetical protein